MTRAFIGYTLRDGQVTLEHLNSLKRQMPLSYNTFIDIIDNNSEKKQERVIEELRKSDITIFIQSPEALNSKWLNLERVLASFLSKESRSIDIKNIKICKSMAKHKVFISYHHQNDQWAKDRLIELNKKFNFFIDCSVDTGDIPETWDDQHIRTEIRDNYLRDSTVTVLLVGTETKNRKHIDWELYSSMFDGSVNKKSGIVVIMLPSTGCTYCHCSHESEKTSVFPQIQDWTTVNTRNEFERRFPYMPARIIDNLLETEVRITVANWNDLSVDKLATLIDDAANDRTSNEYDMSRQMKRLNS